MAALFPPWSNTVLRVALAAFGTTVVAVPALPFVWERTPYVTGQTEPSTQPVKFDHRHHSRDDGIDCLFCHDGARRSRWAGVPPVALCMGCHAQIWRTSPELSPVRAAWERKEPLAWRRVNRLPDFVFFDHAPHVAKGVGCVECHGRVDRMGQVYATEPLTMSWCLGCHRNPAPHLRPLDRVTDMEWSGGGAALGDRLARERNVHPPTDCSGCHR